MTLENIILLFQDIATRHKQINGFVVSEDYNLGSIDDSDFPLLAIVPTNPNLPRDVNGFSMFTMDFEIKLLDLVNDDLNNKIHVYSDSIEILKDIVNEFNTHPYYHELGLDVISDASMEKLEEFTDTDLYGYGVELTLASPNKISFCGSPITDITGFNSGGGASDATVTNTSGSYNTLVNAGGTLVLPDITHIDSDGSNVVTPAQEVFTATPAADSTIENTTQSYTTNVSSGGTLVLADESIQVTDSSGNVLSSITNPLYENITIDIPVMTQSNDWLELVYDTSIVQHSIAGTIILGFAGGTFFVDWGDGSAIEHIKDITGVSDTRLAHVYPDTGTYTVRLKGDGEFSMLQADGHKIVELRNWGLFFDLSINAMLFGMINMVVTATDAIHSSINDGRNAFRTCAGIVKFPLKLNTSRVTIFSSMFQDCTNFDDGESIGEWDMSSMSLGALNMFFGTSMSTASCDAILIGWTRWSGGQTNINLNSNQSLHLGTTSYTLGGDAEDAFNYLVNTLNWTITIL